MKNVTILVSAVFVLLVGISCSVPNPVAPVTTAPHTYTIKYEVIESPSAYSSSLAVRFWSNNGTVGGGGASVVDSAGGDFYWTYTFTTTNTSFPVRLHVTNMTSDPKTFTGRIYIDGVIKRERTTNGTSTAIIGDYPWVAEGELAGTVASLQ